MEKYKPVSVEYINPFLAAMANVFRTMLFVEIERGPLYLKEHHRPDYAISGVIGMSGKAVGTIVLSLSREVALGAAEAMLGEPKHQIDADVVDVVGELANMIAGSAKASLEELAMTISLPHVVIGTNHTIIFPTGVTPLGIPFSSPWGPVCIEVGLCEKESDVAVAV